MVYELADLLACFAHFSYNQSMMLDTHESVASSGGLDINTLVILMVIASIVAVVVKKIKVPYTVALVLVGLVLGFLHAFKPIPLTEHLVLFIFLPALLFEASWNLDVRHLKKSISGIAVLATIGVAFSIFIIGAVLNYFLGMPWVIALMFGAIIAPTDPVSVVAIMKKMHLDHKISALVEGESLFNDGTSVVFFKLILAMLMSYGLTVPQEAIANYLTNGLVQFFIVVVGGAALGAVLGLCFSVITKFFDDHSLELTFTTIVAYGSFLVAESIAVPGEIQGLHLSGVVATVSAGLVMGNYGRQTGMSASTRIVISSFWEYAAFFMNSLVFLLIGLEIQIDSLVANWLPVSVAILAVLVARLLSVYLLCAFGNVTKFFPMSLNWQHVLAMSGLKGALSMALVLSIPRELIASETRELLILMVFGVVLFSLIPQGLSISWFLKILNLGQSLSPELNRYQFLKAKLRTAKGALESLFTLQNQGEVMTPVAKELREELEAEIEEAQNELEELHVSNEVILLEDKVETKTQLLKQRKVMLEELASKGAISNDTENELGAQYDAELERLQSKH